MTRCRFLLVGTLTLGCVAVPTVPTVASASASSSPCDSWRAPISGSWSNAANWTGGVPGDGAATAVCITVPGTYTVTLAPWDFGTSDFAHPGASVVSLTLGATHGKGRQTLKIDGVSSTSDSNEQVNVTSLSTTAASVIRARGHLVLATTDGGTKPKGVPYGGYASVNGAAYVNYGTITTTVQDPKNKVANITQFYSALNNKRGGIVADKSGLLAVNSVANNGEITVAEGAAMDLASQGPGGLPSGVFTNSGVIRNGGTVSAQGGTWAQLGGEITGNPVALQDGTNLVDRAGPAMFLANAGSAGLSGTVPEGQTITVVGSVYNYQGENYNVTTLGLGGTTVVNDGSIVLDAQGPKTTGGGAVISGGTIRNNGSIVAEVEHSSWTDSWQIGLVNNESGRVTVAGGVMNESGDGSDTNAGTVTLAPGAAWLLQEGSAFTNEAGGRIVPEIAGPTRVGQFDVASPCCNGPGVVNAGGELVPTLVGGYKPPAKQEFPVVELVGGKFVGTFMPIKGAFKADYNHETTSPAFVGIVYQAG
jgi:hypothetical protein